MTYDAGGYGPAGPPPGSMPTGYPPPGYPGGPPVGYGPPPYWQPPGYQYGGPGYPPPFGRPPAVKPGVVPLRPLTLSDIFNGAVGYVRANPKATLGLTTIVVVAAQVVALLLSLWPITLTGQLADSLDADTASTEAVIGWVASGLAVTVTTALSSTLLGGMLTVVIGRSIFGAGITIGDAWRRLRPRFWALIGFTVLKALGVVLWFGGLVLIVLLAVAVVDGPIAILVAAPLVLLWIAVLVYLGVMLTFTPSIVVLERRDILTGVRRSFALIKGDFWRVFGIGILALIVAQFVAAAVSIPFTIGSQVALTISPTTASFLLSMVLASVGGAIGQIITGPFSAGVVVLQYTDRRIRAEAFDFVLQTGAAAGPTAPAESTDDLWLTGPR
jgi:hypothetical protein